MRKRTVAAGMTTIVLMAGMWGCRTGDLRTTSTVGRSIQARPWRGFPCGVAGDGAGVCLLPGTGTRNARLWWWS
jgi:hypothetical protein